MLDGIMYYHIYYNLWMLAKSNELGKNVLSMNSHYLELLNFLTDIEDCPNIAFDKDCRVFVSEERLYEVEHRSAFVYEELFVCVNECESSDLSGILVNCVAKMKEKLTTYCC